mmetsp:Transcript_14446/g.25540  ORF Transcript_14446/g.25540 Transcript_14446/m.25540 type:complete len:90 (+) Transcript_14446:130-399(+)
MAGLCDGSSQSADREKPVFMVNPGLGRPDESPAPLTPDSGGKLVLVECLEAPFVTRRLPKDGDEDSGRGGLDTGRGGLDTGTGGLVAPT